MWKSIIIFSVVLFNVPFLIATEEQKSNDEIMAHYVIVMKKCNETFQVSQVFTMFPAYLESFRDSGSFPDETVDMPKCYIRCLLTSMEVLSEDKFKPAETAVVYTIINEGTDVKDVEKVATECSNRNETSKCDRGYEYLKCIKTTMLDKQQ